MTWEDFASGIRTFQIGFMGEPKEVRPGRGVFHENPSTCICEDSTANKNKISEPRKYGKDDVSKRNLINGDVNADDDPDMDDDEDQNDLQEMDMGMFNGTSLDYESQNSEDPELEEIISD